MASKKKATATKTKAPAKGTKETPTDRNTRLLTDAKPKRGETLKVKRRKPKLPPLPTWADGLTPKEYRMVTEYIIDLNTSAAARRAGYSAKTAHVIGHEVLRKPKVAAAVRAAKAERSQRTQITADRVLQELAAIAFTKTSDLVVWSEDAVEKYEPSQLLSDTQAASVSRIKSKKTTHHYPKGESETTHEMELWQHDKASALREMGKHLGITERMDMTIHEADDSLTDGELAEETRRNLAILEEASE